MKLSPHRTTAAALFAGALLCAGPLQACEALVQQSARPPYPYGPRDGGAYCEGTYALNVAAGFEVVSVTIGSIPYAPGVTALYVSAPLSPSDAGTSIRARGRSTTLGYQLDAAIAGGGRFLWRTNQILGPLGLGRRDFGVFGYRRSGANLVYVPVAVGQSAALSDSAVVLVTAIAPEHLNGPVEYRVVRSSGSTPWGATAPTGLNRGSPLVLRLPASELASPLRLEVRAPARADPARFVRLMMTLSR